MSGTTPSPHPFRRHSLALLAIIFALLASSLALAADYTLLDEEPGEYTLSCRLTADTGWAAAAEVRFGFDVRSPTDMAFVRVGGGRATLFLVAGGKEQPVGEPRPFQPPKACAASLQRREGRVRFIADGRVLIDAEWKRPLGGRAGTLAAGGAQLSEVVLQPIAPPLIRDDFTRDEGETDQWQVLAGAWRNTMITAPKAEAARSANPFCTRASAAPEAVMVNGDWFWETYRTSVSAKSVDASTVGIAAYVQDAQNMIQFRWEAGAPDAPRAKKLLLVRNGRVTPLAEGAGGFIREQWYQLSLDVRPGHVTALIDRYPVLSAATDAFGQGEAGLLCQEGDAVFDDFVVGSPASADTLIPRVNPVFVSDDTMAADQLYLPASQWRPVEGGIAWNWGEYVDDVTLRFPVRALGGDPATILLHAPIADAAGAAAAYAVSLRKVGEKLTAELKAPPDKTAAGSCSAAEADEVAVSIAGGTLAVRCGSSEVLTYQDPTPLSGRKLGLSGAVGSLPNLALVTSSRFFDYTFDGAPTDWFAGKGVWQVTTRWPCQPGWTFFGGTHDENPVLWTKHKYEGDVVLEFFAALPMDCPPPPGYARPSDIDAVLCGDGVELSSGYAFVVSGWKNTKSAILRRGQVVAENASAIFHEPTSNNFAFHRHWFRVRGERIGSHIALWLDGQLVASFEDPDPLPGGRAAVWSFHNGLMLGRARLWFAQEKPGGIVPPLASPTVIPPTPRAANAPIADDFETSLGEWQSFSSPPTIELAPDSSTAASGKRSLRITDLVSGGSFGAYAVVTPFRATDSPKLSFDYRLPPGVRVNLYLYLNDRWHAITLTTEEPPSSATTILGRLEGIQADDKWHHAEFDLLTPLQALYPQLKAFTVKYVAVAAPEESYVRCGIGGNGRGARFWIDNFAVGPRG